MRYCYYGVQLLLFLFLPLGYAAPVDPPQRLLQQMVEAGRSSDYELLFLQQQPGGFAAFRYRHALIDRQPIAQLLALEGPLREVRFHGSAVSCFGPEQAPSGVLDQTIRGALPRVLQADFKRLAAYYTFTRLPIARIADRDCQIIRITPRDPHRYGYLVGLDCQSKLLLQAALLLPSGEPVEQFRAVSLSQGKPIRRALRRAMVERPALPSTFPPPQTPPITTWQPGWLPAGFTAEVSGQRLLPNRTEPVDTQLYSDGLLTIALYVHRAPPAPPLELQERYCSIYSEVRSGWEITVVGELPLASARQIARRVIFDTP